MTKEHLISWDPLNIQQIVTECQLHTGLHLDTGETKVGVREGLFPGVQFKRWETNHKQAKGADCTEDRVMRQKVPEVRREKIVML